jgi:hypothetical protein
MFLTHLLLFAILLALVPSLRRFFGVVAMWALTFVQIAAVCWVVWLLWDRIVTYAEVADSSSSLSDICGHAAHAGCS